MQKSIYGDAPIVISTYQKPDVSALSTEAAKQVNYYNMRLLDIMKQVSAINTQADRERVVQRVELLKSEMALKVKLATAAVTDSVSQSK
jgi:hypothetical protein